jgi:excisionase family DNA binding protein
MTDALDRARQVAEDAKNADERARFDLAAHRRPFVTANAVADYLDVDPRTIVRMIKEGALIGVKVGRAWRIPTEKARAAFHVEAKTA